MLHLIMPVYNIIASDNCSTFWEQLIWKRKKKRGGGKFYKILVLILVGWGQEYFPVTGVNYTFESRKVARRENSYSTMVLNLPWPKLKMGNLGHIIGHWTEHKICRYLPVLYWHIKNFNSKDMFLAFITKTNTILTSATYGYRTEVLPLPIYTYQVIVLIKFTPLKTRLHFQLETRSPIGRDWRTLQDNVGTFIFTLRSLRLCVLSCSDFKSTKFISKFSK